MRRIIGAMAGSLLLALLLIIQLWRESHSRSSGLDPLIVYCAASNRSVIEQVAEAYESQFGGTVQIQYGASQSLLSSIAATETGDVYLPADDLYATRAERLGLVAESVPVATMRLGLAVRRGNPLEIRGLEDLTRDGVRLVQANPETAASGRLTRSMLTASGQWDQIARATVAFTGSVTEAANDVVIGSADVAIVYDVLVPLYEDLEFVSIEALAKEPARVTAVVLRCGRRGDEARRFADFLVSPEAGGRIYRQHGYGPPQAIVVREPMAGRDP